MPLTWSVTEKRNNADDNRSKVNSDQIKSVRRWLAYSFPYLWYHAKYLAFTGLKNILYKLRAESICDTETYWVTQKQTCSWNRQGSYPNLKKIVVITSFMKKKVPATNAK